MTNPDYRLPVENLPLFIDSPNAELRNMVSISRSYETGGTETGTELDNKEFLVLANAILQSVKSENESSITIHHAWAKDVEGDRSKLADFRLDSLVFKSAYNNSFRYTGWLTSMAFYNPFEDNAFTYAVKKDDTEEHWVNNEYPFSPPRFDFIGVTLPLKVDITVSYSSPDYLNEYRTRALAK
jgi:hypothetical protein